MGGYEYPMCPGTVAGTFDESKHEFVNQQFSSIYTNFSDAMALMRELNPNLKFILTVSPVPLTATVSGKHVVVATMVSKSILRAVADSLATNRGNVDYFPSYEIINSPVFKGAFFEPNQRSVNHYGVNFVMDNFFKCLVGKFGQSKPQTQEIIKDKSLENKKDSTSHGAEFIDPTCDEELLEKFGRVR